MTNTPENMPDPIAQRLAHLRSRPVDLSSLQRRIEAHIPRPAHGTRMSILFTHSARAIAAVLAIGVTGLIVTIAAWSGPALASTDQLLQLHQSVVAHREGMTNVDSMAAANAALAGQWPDAPMMPEMLDHKKMACCVHKIGKAKAACVLLSIDGEPVTLAAAEISEVRMPQMQTLRDGGTDFHISTAQKVSMVMTQRDGHWYCLMGELEPQRLIGFWNTLKK